MLRKALAAAVVGLAILVPAASAKPVRPAAAARAAMRANQVYDNGAGVSALTCVPGKRYGTVCRMTFAPACYQDAVFGLSELVVSQDWWVSSTRGRVTAVPWGHFAFDVYGIPPGQTCLPGQAPH